MLKAIAVRRLTILPLVAIIFLTVSGGPFGLEPLLVYGGRHGALLLLLLTPILWDLPTILMVMEMNSMMPVTGGYYQWVKRALGLRWAWFEGWWTWLYTFVDLAIYPVLFVVYLSFFFPGLAHYKIPICLVMIWGAAIVNILGIVPVGRVSMVLSVLIIVPFLVLFTLHFIRAGFHWPETSFRHLRFSEFGMGLYTVMWNFIGWDNITTYANEVNRPVRTYFVSILLAFLLTISIYFMAVTTALNSGVDLTLLNEQGFPLLGSLIGGNWLGYIIAAGGMAGSIGLFSAVLLSISRIPKVMAEDKLLPSVLQKLHPKYQTPWLSIVMSAAIVSVMVLWTLGDLVIIDITLYGGALLLEFISLIALRIKFPSENRPFKIPLNTLGLILLTLSPLAVYSIALSSAFSINSKMLLPAIFALSALLSAEILWRIIKAIKK